MDIANLFSFADDVENGEWVKSPSFPGVSYLIKGSISDEVETYRESLIEAIPRAQRIKGLSKAARAQVDVKTLSDVQLLDVKGMKNGEKEMPISELKENLLHPKIGRYLRIDAITAGSIVGDDKLLAMEEDAKN